MDSITLRCIRLMCAAYFKVISLDFYIQILFMLKILSQDVGQTCRLDLILLVQVMDLHQVIYL